LFLGLITSLALCLPACQHGQTSENETGNEPGDQHGLAIQADNSLLSDPLFPDDSEFAIKPVSDATIWPHILAGFQLEPGLNHKSVQRQVEWYSRHKDYIDRVMVRSEPFLYYILNEAEKLNLPTELVLLPIVESAFQPFAYSHGRAAGIWQFIPSTGRLYGLKQNWWYDGRRDIYASTQAALKYLNNLNKIFKGDWLLAPAAYNSGPGTVKKAIRKNRRRGKPTDFWHLKLPKETRAYVPKLLALKELISNPEKHEITLRCIPYAPSFERVDAGSQIDLALAAELAEIDIDTLYSYNPAYNRWATAPNGPNHLLLPIEAAETFTTNLASLPEDKRIRWKRHRIRNGESLSSIAAKYSTTIHHLRKVNNMRGNMIREGKYLVIPVASRNREDYALSAGQRKKSIQNSSHGKKRITHIVQNGDSFWKVARNYGVNMYKLAKWNGMAVRDKLQTGQKIVIWKQNDPSNLALNERKPAGTIRSISHKVRNGDSLSKIASRYRVSVNDLHRWNAIKGKYLQPGQRIKVYIDITEQAAGSG
jgi:membrane-bound lytic murein transglycosylase D